MQRERQSEQREQRPRDRETDELRRADRRREAKGADTERGTDRQTEKDTHRERETHTERQRETERERQKERKRGTERERRHQRKYFSFFSGGGCHDNQPTATQCQPAWQCPRSAQIGCKTAHLPRHLGPDLVQHTGHRCIHLILDLRSPEKGGKRGSYS